jgi:uncharacterized membrane protein YdfJ with MMPL/SSD domain
MLAVVAAVAVAVFALPAAGVLRSGSAQFQAASSPYERANATFQRVTGDRAYYGVDVLLRADQHVAARSSAVHALDSVGLLLAREYGFERVLHQVATRGREAVVMAAFATPSDSIAAADHLRMLVSSRRGHSRLGGWGAVIGGPDVAFGELDTQTQTDAEHVERWAAPVLICLCVLVFGGAFLLPITVAGISVVLAFAALRLLAELGVPVSVYCLPAVIGLGLGLGVDYSLLMVSRYREELDRSADPLVAVERMLATAGRTVVVSAVMIAALALASLWVFPLEFLRSIGLAAAVTAVAAGVTARLLLPRALPIFARRPRAPVIFNGRAGWAGAGWWRGVATRVTEHPVPLVILATVMLLAAATPAFGLQLVAPSAQLLPVSSESRQVEHALAKDFAADPAGAMYTIYKPRPHRLSIQALARREAKIAAGRAEMLPARYLGAGTWELSLLPYGAPDSPANQRLLAALRASTTASGALTGGFTAFAVDQREAISSRIWPAAAILLLVSGVSLWLISGSIAIAIKGVLMALLSVAAGIGLLIVILGAVELADLIFMATITIALALDYEIFLISRIREERDRGQSNRQAIIDGLASTGPVISKAALLFCVAVGAFAFSPLLFTRQFGLGAALAVAIDASIVRVLLVPSLMTLLGELNWWSPTPLRQLHRRIDIHSRNLPQASRIHPGEIAASCPRHSSRAQGKASEQTGGC